MTHTQRLREWLQTRLAMLRARRDDLLIVRASAGPELRALVDLDEEVREVDSEIAQIRRAQKRANEVPP